MPQRSALNGCAACGTLTLTLTLRQAKTCSLRRSFQHLRDAWTPWMRQRHATAQCAAQLRRMRHTDTRSDASTSKNMFFEEEFSALERRLDCRGCGSAMPQRSALHGCAACGTLTLALTLRQAKTCSLRRSFQHLRDAWTPWMRQRHATTPCAARLRRMRHTDTRSDASTSKNMFFEEEFSALERRLDAVDAAAPCHSAVR
jgi:hypothetical protein